MMNDLRALQLKYRRLGVILDTNPFLLLLVGLYDPENIPHYKATQSYQAGHFEVLTGFLKPFETIVTTPGILAEVSNLSGNEGGRYDRSYFDSFIGRIRIFEEVYPRSKDFVEQLTFRRLGLTDAGIIDAARRGNYLILTADLPLVVHGYELGIDVINFVHLIDVLL